MTHKLKQVLAIYSPEHTTKLIKITWIRASSANDLQVNLTNGAADSDCDWSGDRICVRCGRVTKMELEWPLVAQWVSTLLAMQLGGGRQIPIEPQKYGHL
ncbi:uncharacterized protein Dyak_GE27649 [Drosophila yakuba]|uniref:Uncharacterized protein n=1 Tax=Drosophila yakuba TaxID=7245 RepID=A0A0R1DM26_DROYA|nr:uncharacterized protein Dyak_GE27649 [Drosophila yakuba]